MEPAPARNRPSGPQNPGGRPWWRWSSRSRGSRSWSRTAARTRSARPAPASWYP